MKFGFAGGNLATNIDSYHDAVSIVRYGEELRLRYCLDL